ncbi:hypothetical protein ACFX2G_005627 [Malus domestica]
MIGGSPLCSTLTTPMGNIVAGHGFTPPTMSCTRMSCTERAKMVCYYYASAPKTVPGRLQRFMKGYAELINPGGKCDGYSDDTVIFGRKY